MSTTLLTLYITIGVVASSFIGGSAQTSTEDLVRAIRSTDQSLRQSAVDYVNSHVAPGQRTPELDGALAAELSRLNGIDLQRRADMRAGRRVESDFPGEYYADVIQAVSRSANPIVISSLVGALGTGGMVQRGLAKFGNDVVVPVIAVASAKTGPIEGGAPDDIPPHVVADALRTLRLLLEQPRERLTRQSIAAITTVTASRLTGGQDPMVIAAACQLAIATGDPGLRARVQQLALSPQELVAMGVVDQRWAERIKATARQLLGIQ